MAIDIKKLKALLPRPGLKKAKLSFLESLSSLVSSGMDLRSVLTAIAEETESKTMGEYILQIREHVNDGTALSTAIEKTGLWGPGTIYLIRLGEKTGQMEKVLRSIVTTEEKQSLFRAKIITAMSYPVFVFFLAVVIGLIVSWFVLPRLITVFTSLNVELPILTRLLIRLGGLVQHYGAVAIPSIIISFFLIVYFLFIYKKTKYIGQRMLWTIPVTRRVIRESELARFGFVMNAMLSVRVPLHEALKVVADTTDLKIYEKAYRILAREIEDGITFQNVFPKIVMRRSLFGASIEQLIVSGEQSGSLPEVFGKIGVDNEERLELTTRSLSVLIEPVFFVVVWVGVIILALAFVLPIYSVLNGIHK